MPRPITKSFDGLFSMLGGFIPVQFLRALAYNESSLDPKKVTPSSNATGLFQVVPVVLKDYNLQHGTNYTLEDVKDPSLNSQIGIGLISRIVKSYEKNHPSLSMDWKSPRYVELVVQGFNAGYSEKGGVGFVVGKMEKAGIPAEKITVDTVAQAAKEMNASKYLYMPERISYAKAVAKTYFAELERDKVSSGPPLVANLEKPNRPLDGTLQGNASVVSLLPKDSPDIVYSRASMGNTVLLLILPLTGLLVAMASRKPRKAAVNSLY